MRKILSLTQTLFLTGRGGEAVRSRPSPPGSDTSSLLSHCAAVEQQRQPISIRSKQHRSMQRFNGVFKGTVQVFWGEEECIIHHRM